MASLLSVFRIEKAKGDQSEYKYTGGGIRCTPFFIKTGKQKLIVASTSRPEPFSCSIIPRDKRAEELIIADTMAR
jgi:hypothetical protein